jgi:hypothetical protein
LVWQVCKKQDEKHEKAELENFLKGDTTAINPEMTFDEQVKVMWFMHN